MGELNGLRQLYLTVEVEQRVKGDLGRTLEIRSPSGTDCDLEVPRESVELDTVRGNLISVSASTSPDNQQQVAGEVRELRDDMGAVAKDIAAASADQGSVTVAKVPR